MSSGAKVISQILTTMYYVSVCGIRIRDDIVTFIMTAGVFYILLQEHAPVHGRYPNQSKQQQSSCKCMLLECSSAWEFIFSLKAAILFTFIVLVIGYLTAVSLRTRRNVI